MTTLTYSWGEFYETMRTCEEYTEEIQKKFAVFEALDRAVTVEEIKEIIKPLTENEINWLNSPCLDGIILGITGNIPLAGSIPFAQLLKIKKITWRHVSIFYRKNWGNAVLILPVAEG